MLGRKKRTTKKIAPKKEPEKKIHWGQKWHVDILRYLW